MALDATTPVILSACRTPVGKYLGGLAPIPAPRLGALVIKEAVRRGGVDPALGVEGNLGKGVQGREGQGPAPHPADHPGLPPGTSSPSATQVRGPRLQDLL